MPKRDLQPKGERKQFFHPDLTDAVVKMALEDAEKQIAKYTAIRDEAVKELERRARLKK